MEIKIGEGASARVERQGEWTVLWVSSGGSTTTVSLTALQALDLAKLIHGSAVTAAMAPRT